MRKNPAFLLVLLLVCSLPMSADALKTNDKGVDVVLLQRRLQELDYFHFKPTGIFGGMTRTAVMRFQENNDLTASGPGIVDDHVFKIIFAPQARRNPVPADVKIPIGSALKGNPSKIGEKTPWSTVKESIKANTQILITDFNTDKTFTMRTYGGENHIEAECITAADYKTYITAFGGAPNWSKRPVLVTVGGKTYAASMQGMPSGSDKIPDNDMSGTCCLYFFGSTSDILNIPDAEHDANIARASSWE